MSLEASQLRDQDLVKWIENKLGDPNEHWGGSQAASLLTKQMIIELENCFQEFEPHVKLKIIQAMLHFSPKLVQTWRTPLTNLINLARRDADEWVETVADMFRDFPEKGSIQCLPTNKDSYFYTTLDELQKLVKEKFQDSKAPVVLPPDCEILSLDIIKSQFGYLEVEQKKHFNVNKNLKSQQLLEELKKVVEFQNNPIHKKNNGIISTFPIKMRSTIRKPNNNLPMKGIPSTSAAKISGGFTNEPKKFQRQLLKREGGAMLIDITELPQLPSKKRKIVESVVTTLKVQKKANENVSYDFLASTSAIETNNKITTQSNFSLQKTKPKISCKKKLQKNTNLEETKEKIMETKNTDKKNFDANINSDNMEKESYLSSKSFDNFSSPNFNLLLDEINLSSTTLKQMEELMRDANKLTPNSYKLIAAFLNGDKTNSLQDNPDSVVTLPLSEFVKYDEFQNAHLIKTYFQINYSTGEWKRLRKSQLLKSDEIDQVDFANILKDCSKDSNNVDFYNNSLIPTQSSTLNLTPTELMFSSHFNYKQLKN